MKSNVRFIELFFSGCDPGGTFGGGPHSTSPPSPHIFLPWAGVLWMDKHMGSHSLARLQLLPRLALQELPHLEPDQRATANLLWIKRGGQNNLLHHRMLLQSKSLQSYPWHTELHQLQNHNRERLQTEETTSGKRDGTWTENWRCKLPTSTQIKPSYQCTRNRNRNFEGHLLYIYRNWLYAKLNKETNILYYVFKRALIKINLLLKKPFATHCLVTSSLIWNHIGLRRTRRDSALQLGPATATIHELHV